jgi:hypothetical protein
MMTLPLMLVVIHFIADFILQIDSMATKKSTSWKALAAHVTVYALCFVWLSPSFFAITWLTHFVTDGITSRITARLYKRWQWETKFLASLPSHPFQPRVMRVDESRVILTGQCGFEVVSNVNSTCFDAEYCNRSPEDHNLKLKKFLGQSAAHWFFAVIGCDQLIHYVTLAYTYHWLIK